MEGNWFLRGDSFFFFVQLFFGKQLSLFVYGAQLLLTCHHITIYISWKKIISKRTAMKIQNITIWSEQWQRVWWYGGRFTIPRTQVEITISSDFNGSTSVSNCELRIYNCLGFYSFVCVCVPLWCLDIVWYGMVWMHYDITKYGIVAAAESVV